eukprot:TRINITY_DN3808_c0_g1_i1.p1 TRINITY_DN3808_c0_g1~~TRINITY_DN3808_c0_g1_i1.p1  ORF type:complete len:176 (+),score=59.50 TRINITY_DN3808_c0_g1_i1:14-541(+)
MSDPASVSLRLSGPTVVARSIVHDAQDGQTVGDFRRSVAARLDVKWTLLKLACPADAEKVGLEEEDDAVLLRGRSLDCRVADEEEVVSKAFGCLDADSAGFVDEAKFLSGLRTLLQDGAELDGEDLEALEVFAAFEKFGSGKRALVREEFERLLFYDEDIQFKDLQTLLLKLGGV